MTVRVQGRGSFDGFDCAAVGSAGAMSYTLIGPAGRLLTPTPNGKIIVTVTSRNPDRDRIAAPGLTLGARHEWVYQYSFTGIRFE
jgi:hypothetical protein